MGYQRAIALDTEYAIAFPLIQQEGNDRAFLTNTSKSAIASLIQLGYQSAIRLRYAEKLQKSRKCEENHTMKIPQIKKKFLTRI